MSDTAQKRDISDPKTVRDFVGQVQTPEMLRLLLVLTVADIRAVGPGVWNGWKGQLLRELYYEAEARDVRRRRRAGARGARRATPRRRWQRGSPTCPKPRANAHCRATTTITGWPSTTPRRSATPG